MEQLILNVKGMSCHHCVNAIEGSVGQLSGVSKVEVYLRDEKVEVEYNPSKTNLHQIKDTIDNQGYDVV
ncbi:copper chaperone CopZ [Bacillus sp. T33-2]|uniref:copper chaperone CopZ n=1 Tax=Bacillus sp. T33-2 TaxID=2054168 RepID=UPI000C77EEB7|nr:copper chaperone CopZ [Bacillus sp. T33-2]PLR98446.1 copper resistance protein CopZ [Bacillus sp. T33-2]